MADALDTALYALRGVSVTIPVAGTNALDNEKRCVSCGETQAFPDVGKVRRS